MKRLPWLLSQALLYCSWTAGASEVCAEIQVCTGQFGEIEYTDVGCPNGQPMDLPDVEFIDLAPLTDADEARLRALDARASAQAAERQRDRKRRSAERLAASVRKAAACTDARDGLRRIRQARRKGYEPAEERQLDAREAEFRAARQANCR